MSDAPPNAGQTSLPLSALATIFFVSGFPALIYQLIWQRALFAIYGINVESVTVIVAAFMCGLGLGSLAGGWLSARRGVPLLLAFALVELVIGAFGACSLWLFALVGSLTLGFETLATGVVTFGLVVLPTMLMGATLPLLVEFLVRRTGNVGRSVGLLYFVNTLGSATACFAAAFFLFDLLGQEGAVRLAAVLNVLVGGGALAAWRWTRGPASLEDAGSIQEADPAEAGAAAEGSSPEDASAKDEATLSAARLPLGIALALSAVAGFVSLSYEILYFRVWSYATGTLAASFALVLGFFLVGIAFGSFGARRFCTGEGIALRALGWFVVAANGIGFLIAPLAARAMAPTLPPLATVVLVAVAAGALGAVLPLVSHAAIPPDRLAGARLSYLYLANVIGSTGGSLLTGFLLLDRLGIRQTSLVLAAVGLSAGAAVLFLAREQKAKIAGGLVLAALPLLASGPLFDGFWERLHFDQRYAGQRFERVVENKSGVISVHVEQEGQTPIVYGGGIYDGRYSVTIVDDPNFVVRCYAVSAFHPKPKRVLEIGLSSGSWAQVLANWDAVESLQIVEINPGYVELIREQPAVQSLLQNPKVTVSIDDGRRWLRLHPNERFDAIVMNTTYHWRSNASNLLSREFLQTIQSHLEPDGIVIYNSTSSPEVFRTALDVFPHVARLLNFVVASPRPLEPDRAAFREALLRWRIDGVQMIDATRDRARLDQLLDLLRSSEGYAPGEDLGWYAFEPMHYLKARLGEGPIITDDNMGTEWRQIWAGAH